MLKKLIEPRHRWLIVAVVLMCVISVDARAESIPPEYLQADYDNCVAVGDSKPQRQYCRCVVEEIEETMTLQEYLEASADVVEQEAAGVDPADAVASIGNLADIIDFCLQKVSQ